MFCLLGSRMLSWKIQTSETLSPYIPYKPCCLLGLSTGWDVRVVTRLGNLVIRVSAGLSCHFLRVILHYWGSVPRSSYRIPRTVLHNPYVSQIKPYCNLYIFLIVVIPVYSLHNPAPIIPVKEPRIPCRSFCS